MRIASVISVFSSVVLAPVLVHAQPGICVSGSPGSPACTEQAGQAQPGPAPVAPGEWQPATSELPAAAPAAAPVDDLSGVTHSFYMPTGNLAPAGKVSVNIHELGVLNTVAYGVSDHVEISVGAPAIPFVWSAAARVSLTGPDSPLRAVVGGSVWTPLVQDSGADVAYVTQGTVTLGYQSGKWNIHGSLSGARPSTDVDETLVAASAGFVYRLDGKWAAMADISSLGVAERPACSDVCIDNDFPVRVVTAGMKYMGSRWDVDLGFFVPFLREGEGTRLWLLPLVSFHRH